MSTESMYEYINPPGGETEPNHSLHNHVTPSFFLLLAFCIAVLVLILNLTIHLGWCVSNSIVSGNLTDLFHGVSVSISCALPTI